MEHGGEKKPNHKLQLLVLLELLLFCIVCMFGFHLTT